MKKYFLLSLILLVSLGTALVGCSSSEVEDQPTNSEVEETEVQGTDDTETEDVNAEEEADTTEDVNGEEADTTEDVDAEEETN